MTASHPFVVDLDDLDAAVGVLTTSEQRFDEQLDDVRRLVAALHADFEGLSAQAHLAAQQEWEGGYAQMRQALADLREAARTAHDNYQGAVAANLRTWGR